MTVLGQRKAGRWDKPSDAVSRFVIDDGWSEEPGDAEVSFGVAVMEFVRLDESFAIGAACGFVRTSGGCAV